MENVIRAENLTNNPLTVSVDKRNFIAAGEEGVVQEIGVLILIKVAGNAVESASIESFKALKKFWEYGPIELETRIKNEGNTHIKPVGKITIQNIFGKTVALLDVHPKNILPGAVRKGNAVL